MKKLFTLVALLAMFLGANAQGGKWEQVYTIDYTTYQGFPFYVMGYVPEFDNGYMTDFGANYKYAEVKDDAEETSDVIVTTQGGAQYYRWTEGGGWHQYFIADGIPTKIDGKYKVIAKVKASESASINVNMGWGWGDGQQVGTSVSIPAAADFEEVEWQYEGVGGSSCNLVAQPGTSTATIEWQSLTVYEWQKDGQRPKVWLEDLENGDAETPWGDLANVAFNDMENNFKVCAWSKERGENMNEDEGWDPFPATIEEEEGNPSNHVFVCHGKAATTEGDAAAWDNQFWIQSTKPWKSGSTVKIKFRYKASKTVEVETQTHKQTPSDYLIWHGIGNVTFTEEWQTFEKDVTFADDMNNGWSFAFNLNAKDKEAIDFYFDDLSWQYLQLDEGYFVSGINSQTTTSYDDLDDAIEFEYDEEQDVYIATVGEAGNADSYVDQIMISTTRGDDQAFKGATLKVNGKITNPEEWYEYTEATNARLDLFGLGVWKIYLDVTYNAIQFEMLEGTPYEQPDPVEVVTNTTLITVNGQERDDLSDTFDDATGERTGREEEGGAGETWDNQFFIVANRALVKGEVTHLHFKYKASVEEAKTTTQCHVAPGAYKHWAAIGDVTFTDEWQEFDQDFTVPADADGMKSIAFNMAEIKEACDYEITDFQWYLADTSLDEGMTYENLIDEEGDKNFWVKEGAGTAPYQPSNPTGIIDVINDATTGSNVIYNLSGQRVSKDYKGIVIINGRKVVNK